MFNQRHVASKTYAEGPTDILHVFQFGQAPRTTAIICASLFLHIQTRHPELLNSTLCNRGDKKVGNKREVSYFLERSDIPQAVMSQVDGSKLPPMKNTTVVFASAPDERAAAQKKLELRSKGYTVGIVQNLQTMKETQIREIVMEYASFFHLTSEQISMMIDYFELWDQLRECCGMQMSKHFRNELLPDPDKHTDITPHDYCGSIDFDEVETKLMNTDLYKVLGKSKLMDRIRRPSAVDGDLDGMYCSRYNDAVRKHGITMNHHKFGINNWFVGVQNHLVQETSGDPLEELTNLLDSENKKRTGGKRGHKFKKSEPEFSPWVQEYIAFHQASIVDGKLKDDARYIVYECKDGSVRCGGAGDRLIGMIKVRLN